MADSTLFHLVVTDDGDYKKAFQDRDKASGYFDKLATAGKEVWLMLCSIKNNSMVLLRHYPGNSPVNGGADSPQNADAAPAPTRPALSAQPSASDRLAQDLTAPLRAMRGYARLVAQKHAAVLNGDAQELLSRIDANAERVSAFVAAFAAFAATATQPLAKVRVDPLELVREVLAEDERVSSVEVEIRVADLPACEADPALLKLVFAHLLSKALKFSAGRNMQFIEVGATESEGVPVYFVRDNGVGFDMQAAEGRLFGLCQRLHPRSEFAGDGIGLALVARIVERHGGRIWARATPEKGATFFFTLAPASKVEPSANDVPAPANDLDSTDPGRDGFSAALRRAYEDYVLLLARYRWCARYRPFLDRPAGALLSALCPTDAALERLIDELNALQPKQDVLIAKLRSLQAAPTAKALPALSRGAAPQKSAAGGVG